MVEKILWISPIKDKENLKKIHLENYLHLDHKRKCLVSNIFNNTKPIYEMIGEDNHTFFLIDFDSILIELIEAPQFKFLHNLQTLSIIHCLERRLTNFYIGKKKPIIIAFKVLERMWPSMSNDIFFLRKLLIMHLQVIKKIPIYIFEEWWCPKWCNFIQKTLPSFIMISTPGSIKINRNYDYMWESMLVYLHTCQSVPVVFSSQIFIKSNALYGSKIEISTRVSRFCKKYFGNLYVGLHSIPISLFNSKSLKNDLRIWYKIDKTNTNMQEKILLYALTKIFKKKKKYGKSYSGLILLSHIIKKNLPLQCRKFILSHKSHPKLINYLNTLYSTLKIGLSNFEKDTHKINRAHYKINKKLKIASLDFNLTDLIDARFLHYISQKQYKDLLSVEKIGLKISDINKLIFLWDILCNLLNIPLRLSPLIENKALYFSKKNLYYKYIEKKRHLLIKFNSKLMDSTIFNWIDDTFLKNNLLKKVDDECISSFFKEIKQKYDINWEINKKINDKINREPAPKTVK